MKGGTWDMGRSPIVAYKRSWSESSERRGTEILKTDTPPLSLGSRIGDRDDQERRFYEVGFYSLLGIKNCPTNGGKLTFGGIFNSVKI